MLAFTPIMYPGNGGCDVLGGFWILLRHPMDSCQQLKILRGFRGTNQASNTIQSRSSILIAGKEGLCLIQTVVQQSDLGALCLVT